VAIPLGEGVRRFGAADGRGIFPAGVECARQFFQALADKDYRKAGLIVCGEMEDDAKAEYGKLTVAAIVSVGPAEPQPKWVKRGYKVPCELKVVHPDGRQSAWTPGVYVRPGDDEMHPDHWNITGEVNLSEAGLRMLPDNAKYEKMSPKEAAAAFEKNGIIIETLADRVKEVVRSAFNGRRIVIFSGGEAKGTDEVLKEVTEIAAGGAFGSIMGRNAFQRPKAEAIKLLHAVMDIYKKAK